MECLKSLLENHQMGNVQIHTYAINVIDNEGTCIYF